MFSQPNFFIRSGLRCPPSIAALFFFLLLLAFEPAWPTRASAGPSDPLWRALENAWNQSGDVLQAPFNGSAAGYGAAAGVVGLMVAAGIQDRVWYQAVADHPQPWEDRIMPIITLGGEGGVHVAAYAGLYLLGGPSDRAAAEAALEGQIVIAMFAVALKAAFTASRPAPADHPAERTWFTLNWTNQSFPSGHSMSAFCAAAVLGHYYSAEWITYPLAALVAYSRVYNHYHWPLDVIAGSGLGWLIGQTVVSFHERRDGPEPSAQLKLLPRDDGAMAVWSCRF